jgi:hypothetical protein
MSIEMAGRQYHRVEGRIFAGTLADLEVVCLFSALGMILTIVALMLGGPEVVDALMLAGG